MSERGLVLRNGPTWTPAPVAGGLLRRACACGRHTLGGGACRNCRGESETIERAGRSRAAMTVAPLFEGGLGWIETGHTDCDWKRDVPDADPFLPKSGEARIQIADGDSCTKPCTAEHEKTHKAQLTPLCKRYFDHYTAAPGVAAKDPGCKNLPTPDERRKCLDLTTQSLRLDAFEAIANAWEPRKWECEAYRISDACARKLQQKDPSCSGKLGAYRYSAAQKIKENCGEEESPQKSTPPAKQKETVAPVPLRSEVNYIAQLTSDDAKSYLEKFDQSLDDIDKVLHDVKGPEADELRLGATDLRALRARGKVTAWYTSGGIHFASFDNATGEVRLHIYFKAATFPSTLIHEAIHQVHAGRFAALSRAYAEALAAGRETNESLGPLLLKWKAWTEYWAYRRGIEYYNLRQTPEFRRDPHETAMEEAAVKASLARVREATGEEFAPDKWTPPDKVPDKRAHERARRTK
jgi:hypothetical protein